MNGVSLKTNLSHQEVMRVSFRTGQLIRHLHGQPGLVLGIARGGVPPAQAFAAGAGVSQVQTLLFQRSSSSGVQGGARKQWVRIAPEPLRLIYKQFMFKPTVRVMDAVTPDRVLPSLLTEKLSDCLTDKDAGPVVVVDDAIDSGGTIKAVVKAIRRLSPGTSVIVFSLASTLGRTVNEIQYTLVSGHIAHFIDGDLSHFYEQGGSVNLAAVTHSRQFFSAENPLQMYLDLDGTLTSDSFRDAIHCLVDVYVKQRAFLDSVGLMTMRLLKKVRLISHLHLKQHLDVRICQLDEASQALFIEQLAVRLRAHSRTALHAAAKAPLVEGAIVTAALESYRSAIEIAFDLPVISGSGFDQQGDWVEIGSDEKITAIENCRSGKAPSSAILLGDTMTDGLTLGEGLNVVMIPASDKTGLLTLLGLSSWWFNPVEH